MLSLNFFFVYADTWPTIRIVFGETINNPDIVLTKLISYSAVQHSDAKCGAMPPAAVAVQQRCYVVAAVPSGPGLDPRACPVLSGARSAGKFEI
jgi:hypothetical protein